LATGHKSGKIRKFKQRIFKRFPAKADFTYIENTIIKSLPTSLFQREANLSFSKGEQGEF
jgi:hypothetical protein